MSKRPKELRSRRNVSFLSPRLPQKGRLHPNKKEPPPWSNKTLKNHYAKTKHTLKPLSKTPKTQKTFKTGTSLLRPTDLQSGASVLAPVGRASIPLEVKASKPSLAEPDGFGYGRSVPGRKNGENESLARHLQKAYGN